MTALPTLPRPPTAFFDIPLFADLVRGTFIDRPNRFVVRCALDGGVTEAYLPNPGRLWELLLPGQIVYLAPKPPGGSATLAHTAVAVEREGVPLLLHTHLANAVAAALIREKMIPGLENATVARAEVRAGRSRFDFLLERGGKPFYLEVKSCTLVGRRIAMFPDAVTERGKRHLEELAALSRGGGIDCGVLFVVHWPRARFFLPDYHSDLEFARTFLAVKGNLMIKAVALAWRPDLSLSPEVREVAVPWDAIEREAKDSGSYIMMIHISRAANVAVGRLGRLTLPDGYYLYVGSARRALTKRMERHIRKGGAVHWHIDYLKEYADRCMAIPVRSSSPLEHELAAAVGRIADGCVPAFGSTDCGCASHLFYFTDNPLRRQPFIDLLQYFRIDRLEGLINS